MSARSRITVRTPRPAAAERIPSSELRFLGSMEPWIVTTAASGQSFTTCSRQLRSGMGLCTTNRRRPLLLRVKAVGARDVLQRAGRPLEEQDREARVPDGVQLDGSVAV